MNIKRVTILIESSRSYGRGLIRGIAKFIGENKNWQIEYRPRGLTEPVPHWIRNWKGDGILARINNKNVLRLLLKKKIPVVDLRRSFASPRIPQQGKRITMEKLLCIDNRKHVRLHLLAREIRFFCSKEGLKCPKHVKIKKLRNITRSVRLQETGNLQGTKSSPAKQEKSENLFL